MRGKLILFSLVCLFLSGCTGHLQLVSISDGTTILGEYHRNNRSIKITMPDGEVLQGSYSALSDASIGFGSSLTSARTATTFTTATEGTTEAYALLRGNKGTTMELVLRYSEWSGSGHGVAKTNKGAGYRVIFPVSGDNVAALSRKDAGAVNRTKSKEPQTGNRVEDAGAEGNAVSKSKESTGIGDPKALVWLGKSYQRFQDGNWIEVIKTTSAAIERDPTLEGAYLNRAWAYYKEGSFDQSAKDCTTVIELNPESVFAYNYRGLAYAEKGLFDQAFKDFDRAVRLDSKNPITLNNRGVVFQRKGNKEEALLDYKVSCEARYQLACENYRRIAGSYPAASLK
jgi:tetratricopeptide (TPR) repeat protein